MSTVLDFYGQYNPESSMDWEGLKSSKFTKTRRHFKPNNTIKTDFQMPPLKCMSGRKHYQQKRSPESQFRKSLKKVQINHWKARQSCKRIVINELTKPLGRPQKRHLSPLNRSNDKYQGLRTFYNLGVKNHNKQYYVEDKMQRKCRASPYELRRSFFQNESKSLILNSRNK